MLFDIFVVVLITLTKLKLVNEKKSNPKSAR